MRIKFLSVIVSFIVVSLAITSCLDSDENYEYSPDATIHAFALDTVHGVNYRFTINQFGPDGIGEIYNQDSLPVGSDTIIDKILIKTLTTVSGVVTSKNSLGQDTIMNLSDSLDLRSPITIKVWSTEALSGALDGITKEYKITVNVHKQDPDSMQWVKMNSWPNGITGMQKSVILDNKILVYAGSDLYEGTIDKETSTITSWKQSSTGFLTTPTSVVNFKNNLYATVDNKVYSSSEGSSWSEVTVLGTDVKRLLAAFPDSLTAIKTDANGELRFCKSDGSTAWVEKDTVPGTFPENDIVSTVYTSLTGVVSAMLVGTPNETNQYTVPWFATAADQGWAEMNTTVGKDTPYPSCPYMKNPSIIRYNEAFYIFGGDFDGFSKSMNGIAWYPADSKFGMPEEFKSKSDKQYSAVVDKNNFIWIIWNDGEVWRGRLNKLGFKNMQ